MIHLTGERTLGDQAETTKHTPGPWEWITRPGSIMLIAPYRGQLTVMDFVRMGMSSAQPRFSDRGGEKIGGLMHKTADTNLNAHPDARLIAAAPDLLEALRPFALMAEGLKAGWKFRHGQGEVREITSEDLQRAAEVVAKAESPHD